MFRIFDPILVLVKKRTLGSQSEHAKHTIHCFSIYLKDLSHSLIATVGKQALSFCFMNRYRPHRSITFEITPVRHLAVGPGRTQGMAIEKMEMLFHCI